MSIILEPADRYARVVNTINATVANTANAIIVNTANVVIVNTAINAIIINTANVSIVNTANVSIVNTSLQVSITNLETPYTLASVVGQQYATANSPIFNNYISPTTYPTRAYIQFSMNTTAILSIYIYNSVTTSTATLTLNVGSPIPANTLYEDSIILASGDAVNITINTTGTINLLTLTT